MQRRNQKVLGGKPLPPASFMNEELARKWAKLACTAAKVCGYRNAGTIEFFVDKNGEFYFMEMNTCIQVEHPITEAVTGVDLVKLNSSLSHQDRGLSIKQEDKADRSCNRVPYKCGKSAS